MRHQISGRVIKGDGYGKTLGFPTANLDRRNFSQRKLRVKFGVYAGTALVPSNKKYKAGIVIGPMHKGLPKIESHLIGFKGNLYGKKLILHLHKYLRPFRKFRSAEELKWQISEDVNLIKKLKYN